MPEDHYAGDHASRAPDKKCSLFNIVPASLWKQKYDIKQPVQTSGDQPPMPTTRQGTRPSPRSIDKFDVNICTHPPIDHSQAIRRRNGLFSADVRSLNTSASRFPLPRLPSYQNRETQFLFVNPKGSNSLISYCFEVFINACCVLIDIIFVTTLLCGDCRDKKNTLWSWIGSIAHKRRDDFSIIETDMD